MANTIDMDERIGEFFSYRELVTTNHRLHVQANIDEGWALRSTGRVLCRSILDPTRKHFGRSYHTSSAFRTGDLNKAIGGSKTSQHPKFEAHDGFIDGVPLEDLFDYIRKSDMMFGQVILEGWANKRPSWVHVSLGAPFRNIAVCRQAKISRDGGITFESIRPDEPVSKYL